MTFFDELIGEEPDGSERDRLRSVHNLLLEAGPPPELKPEQEAGPTLAMSLSRTRAVYSRRRRTWVLTAAAAALVALAIGLGFGVRGHGNRWPSFSLRGTTFAPEASGTIDLLPSKGSRPRMKIVVSGLPPLKQPYVVYVVRNGHPVAPCGRFVVSSSSGDVTKVLVSPYRYRSSDTWIVTEPRNDGGLGATVLQPA